MASWGTRTALVALLALSAACDGGSTGPEAPDRVLAIQGGDGQLAAVGTTAPEPLQVVVSDAATEEPLIDVAVEWEVITGAGATLTPSTSRTDSSGIASTRLTIGPDSGLYEVRASTRGMVGTAPIFRIHAITDPPTLTSITPTSASVGDTVTLEGSHFSTTAEENRVLFAGVRALVISATSTQIRAVVPPCLPSRAVPVRVTIGPFASGSVTLEVQGDGEPPLDLAPGEVATVASPDQVGCLRLPESASGTEYLVIPHNASESAGSELFYRLVGVAGAAQTTALRAGDAGSAHAVELLAERGMGPLATRFEARLRQKERALPAATLLREAGPDGLAAAIAPPQVGDQKKFNVLNENDEFTEVTAVVKHVSRHAVIYQDERAPSGGFTTADFQRFGSLFDDPIYQTDVDVFGAPSDVDGNGLITILFTPVVNELTPEGAQGFVAGFFFGFDLTTQPGSNRAEIFYSVVPDPSGQFGDARSTTRILDVVPPVLAHEFQHMIHFNQRVLIRGASQESLWLSEGLAHMAEDLVGEVFLARGDTENATDFKASNFARAFLYLKQPDTVSLLAVQPPGELGERGAAWLFLRYLMGHYGGTGLITSLTQTTLTSVSNVRTQTGRSWAALLADWFIATYADDAPELAGVTLEPRFTYPEVNLRQIFSQVQGGFPLQPQLQGVQDFAVSDTLPASSPDYFLVRATTTTPRTLNLRMTAGSGGAFASEARPQLSVLRLR